MILKLSRSLWLALLWSAIIFLLLSIPGKSLPQAPPIASFDKIIHIVLFGVQSWLWCHVIKYRAAKSSRSIIVLLVILLSTAYGIGMEYYQHYFVENRSFELGDIIADFVGSLLGGVISFRWLKAKV